VTAPVRFSSPRESVSPPKVRSSSIRAQFAGNDQAVTAGL
jgi:hypothetical protein